jgi:DNA-binding TFAR19-related protein (PDSD5 family)
MTSEEDLKQKKLEELKEAYQKQQEAQQKQMEAEIQANSILKKFVDEAGIERLNNVKLVNKELYFSTFQAIMQMVQNGYIRKKLNEAQIKEILMRLKPEKEIKIKRK